MFLKKILSIYIIVACYGMQHASEAPLRQRKRLPFPPVNQIDVENSKVESDRICAIEAFLSEKENAERWKHHIEAEKKRLSEKEFLKRKLVATISVASHIAQTVKNTMNLNT